MNVRHDGLMLEIGAHGNLSAARTALSHYGLDQPAVRVDVPGTAGGFSGALVLCVSDDEHAYCLRRWPLRGLSLVRLRELHHFLRHLASADITQIAVPLADQRGDTLVTVDGRMWQLEPWMPGAADFHHSPNDARLRSAMHVLARVHLAAEHYDCRPAGRRWFFRTATAASPACRERRQLVEQWTIARAEAARTQLDAETAAEFRDLGRELLRLYGIARASVHDQLMAAEGLSVMLHPCLRDVWHDHLLFTDDELTGLIDPAATRAESVAADLSRLLGSLLEDDRGRWDFALSAYGEVRPITANERRLLTVMDRSSILLSGLTWISRRLDGTLADEDIPRVIPRLQTNVERLRRLCTATT